MAKSNEQKRLEADFRKLRGDIVNYHRTHQSFVKFNTKEDGELDTNNPLVVETCDMYEVKIRFLLNALYEFPQDLVENAFDEWVGMETLPDLINE